MAQNQGQYNLKGGVKHMDCSVEFVQEALESRYLEMKHILGSHLDSVDTDTMFYKILDAWLAQDFLERTPSELVDNLLVNSDYRYVAKDEEIDTSDALMTFNSHRGGGVKVVLFTLN
jgi:hypothetical protein